MVHASLTVYIYLSAHRSCYVCVCVCVRTRACMCVCEGSAPVCRHLPVLHRPVQVHSCRAGQRVSCLFLTLPRVTDSSVWVGKFGLLAQGWGRGWGEGGWDGEGGGGV